MFYKKVLLAAMLFLSVFKLEAVAQSMPVFVEQNYECDFYTQLDVLYKELEATIADTINKFETNYFGGTLSDSLDFIKRVIVDRDTRCVDDIEEVAMVKWSFKSKVSHEMHISHGAYINLLFFHLLEDLDVIRNILLDSDVAVAIRLALNIHIRYSVQQMFLKNATKEEIVNWLDKIGGRDINMPNNIELWMGAVVMFLAVMFKLFEMKCVKDVVEAKFPRELGEILNEYEYAQVFNDTCSGSDSSIKRDCDATSASWFWDGIESVKKKCCSLQ